MEATRESWGSRIGFLLAAAGSAVGLGNIWRFPYMAGSNGGSALIIIYLAFTFTIGLCIMIAELTVGRRAKLSAVGAYKHTSDRWTFAGALGVLSGFLIMGFYPVVGGWALAYVWKSITGLLADTAAIGNVFGGFITSPVQPIAWMLAFLVLNVVIVAKGIAGGIEKAGKILMPALFVMLVLLGIRSITLPGAGAGLAFLFRPDFSAVTGTPLLGVGAFDLFDILTDKVFLAIGGLLLAVFVGWVIRKDDLKAELTNEGTHPFGAFNLWYHAVKYVIPVAIAIVAVVGIISIEQTALMVIGVLVIVVFALFSRKF